MLPPTPRGRVSSSGSSRIGSSPSANGADLEPGLLLAERYRIVALLGRGGMGEVYRADDLRLGQPVALKFLPRTLERDPGRLERFLVEVRTARQVSHQNVCRVYDVGEVGGRHFLSMEYIDGEDLSSLLRRIGRLPPDKGLEIARQLCAALGAAHDTGVLHRDLKPANVMLDGRGKVRLMDFGLAEAEGTGVEGELAGTPAYMAPEQFAGHRASVQTDLYALGLVLYEIFSGKRAFEAPTIAELRRLHERSHAPHLTTTLGDLDPLIERVIFRCLEKDPADRPASALAVAAALPGGDPLAAALAAGETPSPDMVAAAGEQGGMRPAFALGWLAVVLLGLVATTVMATRNSALSKLPLDLSPDVLTFKAREMLARFGYATPAVDSARGLRWDADYAEFVRVHDRGADRWKDLAAGHTLLKFWYRGSPGLLVPMRFVGGRLVEGGNVRLNDPPHVLLLRAICWTLFAAGFVWVLYLALEPPIRRRWPHTLIGWSRLLAGRLTDPLVGRDLLIGAAVGTIVSVFAPLQRWLEDWSGKMPPIPDLPLLAPLIGVNFGASWFLLLLYDATFSALAVFFIVFLLRLVLRNDWLAAGAWGSVSVLQNALLAENHLVGAITSAVVVSLLMLSLFRFGLITFAVAVLFVTVLQDFPLSTDFTSWHGSASILPLVALALIAVYGFRLALAGKPLLGAAD